jgi:hypothetical protein
MAALQNDGQQLSALRTQRTQPLCLGDGKRVKLTHRNDPFAISEKSVQIIHRRYFFSCIQILYRHADELQLSYLLAISSRPSAASATLVALTRVIQR